MAVRDEKRFGIVFTSEGLLSSSEVDPAPAPRVRPTYWPLDAAKLEKPTSSQWSSIALDVVLITTPLILICKTILCIIASHIDASAAGPRIDQVHPITLYLIHFNYQLTTIFTIVFVTIISTLVRRVALWRAQRGASVAELEQWQASISLPSTLTTIWSLQTYTMTSLALVFIWSWYYLGSQASTREYKYQEAGIHRDVQVTVTNPQGPSYLDGQYFSTLNNSQISGSNARFTRVVAPQKSVGGPRFNGYDRNGLMDIPFIDQVTREPDQHGFFEVFDASKAAYATWVGVQVYSMFPNLDYVWTDQVIGELSFNSSYLDVDCGPMRARDRFEFPAGVLPQMAVSLNMTGFNDSSSNPRTFEAWYRTDNISAEVQAMSSVCAITLVPLEIQAQCTAQGCTAKKLKPINISKTESYRTVFDNSSYAANFFSEMLLSTGIPSDLEDQTFVEAVAWSRKYYDRLPSGSSVFLSELEILTASLPDHIQVAASAHQLTVPEMKTRWKLAMAAVARQRSRRWMTPMINAYLSTYQQDNYALDAVLALTSLTDEVRGIINGSVSNPWLTVANLHGTYWEPRYALSTPWVVIDFISCTVLLVAGISAVWLRTRTLAPDILGCVSSLTRDNPYVPLPHIASSLDGLERARILKKVKVRIADVDTDCEVGRVCLTRVEACAQNTRAGKLRRDRWYA